MTHLFRRRGASLAPAAALLLAATSAALVPALLPAARAQTMDTATPARPLNEIRALNLARNEGVRINGGLTVYRPANCMFTTSAATNPCLIRNNAEGFVYRFLGGPPGWEAKGLAATHETEIRISPDGRQVINVLYNGKPR